MIPTSSLLPLGAAVVGASLAWFTLRRPRPLSRRQRLFIGLNVSTAIWSIATFALMNHAPGMEAATFPYDDPGYVISMVMTLGVIGSSLFWFLFAADHAGMTKWTRGPVLWIAMLPGIHTFVAAATNPSHHLFVVQTEPYGRIDIGLASFPYIVGTYGLVLAGIVLLVVGSWTRGTTEGRRQALRLGVASALAGMGGLVWVLREYIPVDPSFNPVPALFALLEIVMVREVVTGGLADLLPHARAAAFDAMHDAAIVLDSGLRVLTLNRSAMQLFPMIEEGMPIDEYFKTLATHARACLETHPEGINFEADLGGCVYWGRARRTGGGTEGCLVLLTDLTDLREAQAELMRLGVQPGSGGTQVLTFRKRERL